MKRLVRNPYFFFYVVAVIMFFIGLKTPWTETNDFNIHDTYIVIGKSYPYFLYSIILMVIGFFYKLVIYKGIKISTGFIKLHWFITILAPVSIWVLPLLYKEETGPSGYLWKNVEYNFNIDSTLQIFIPLSLFLILCLLPFNLIWSLKKAKDIGND